MRRTARPSIAATIPSATACRARSSLDQWVTCSPRATGSRQASCTTRARCRGGKPFGPARTVRCRHQPLHSPPFVEAAGAPDRGAVASHPIGNGIDPLPVGDRQHGAGAADLEPWQRLAAGDLSQGGGIPRPERQVARFSTTHPDTSVCHRRYLDRRPMRPTQFFALLLTGTTSVEEFLGALDTAGELAGSPSLIVLDALNEVTDDPAVWQDELPGMLAAVHPYAHIAVA